MMEEVGSSWTLKAKQLSQLLRGARSDETHIVELLEQLNEFSYPVQGVASQDVNRICADFVSWSRICSGKYVLLVAQFVSKLLTLQKASIAAETRCKLFDAFITSLGSTTPQTELLYASASLLQAGALETASKCSEKLFSDDGLVVTLGLGPSPPSVAVQRAALNLVTTLCSELDVSRTTLLSLLEKLLHCLVNPTREDIDPVLKAKLVLSELKCVHSILSSLSTLQSYPSLPTLLATLKSNMAMGLPGQSKTLASIHPPLSVPSSLGPTPYYQPSSPKQKPQSVAGPHSRKRQHRNKPRDKEKSSGAKDNDGSSGGSMTPEHSSDSDSASGGVVLVGVASAGRRERRRGQSAAGQRGNETPLYSSSESDLSDSEAAPNRLKLVNGKIRFQALSSLTSIFKKLDRQTSFTYWRSFLPDCPRPPNSPPSLLTCIVKDPTPKCRGGAVSVLCALLEGSKPFLAAADDRPRPAQPFTPYSMTLGSIVRELHRSLLLSLTAETHSTTLTQLIKATALLTANSPYHQLSEGYVTKIVTTLLRFSRHKDSDVQVACLTCYGAAVSIAPPLKEVELWLSNSDQTSQSSAPDSAPWLVQHCVSLLQTQSSLAVQTEALQVLSALCKFYFSSSLSRCWPLLKELYLSHLTAASLPLQQHVLKMLEELLRALSSVVAVENADAAVLRSVCEFWAELLGGPLATYIQGSSEHSSVTSQACNVLSTIGAKVMDALKMPFRTLSLTLALSLCRDETASTAATASAIRVIGVFVLYDCLKMDDSFLLDCHSVVLHCLSSTSLPIRVQASWALANLTDILPPSFPPPLLASLLEAIAKASADNDKVKCNAARAAGNMIKDLHEQVLPLSEASVKLICTNLSKSINSGSMKSRWNACYACHSAFSNPVFIANYHPNVNELLKSLCLAVRKCKNFKVRSNAALALSTVAGGAYYPVASAEQVLSIWESLLQALENSQNLGDFSEYKHASTLRTQVCSCICRTLSAMTVEQAQKVGVSKQLSSEALTQQSSSEALTQQSSSEALTQHMYDFMQESMRQESGELSKLVQKAREKLTIFSRDPSLQGLAKLWLQLLTEPTETQVYGERSGVTSQTAANFSPTHA